MFNISKDNIVTMSRGDSWSAPIFLNKGTAVNPIRRVITKDESIYLGIMEPNQPFEKAIVKKVYTIRDLNANNDVVVHIDPEDTECLIPGKYFYQIKSRLIASDTITEDIRIVDHTLLKAGSKLIRGSIINNKPVTQDFLCLLEDTELSENDIIKKFSKILTTSEINGNNLNIRYDVNTVVQKTEFNIIE